MFPQWSKHCSFSEQSVQCYSWSNSTWGLFLSSAVYLALRLYVWILLVLSFFLCLFAVTRSGPSLSIKVFFSFVLFVTRSSFNGLFPWFLCHDVYLTMPNWVTLLRLCVSAASGLCGCILTNLPHSINNPIAADQTASLVLLPQQTVVGWRRLYSFCIFESTNVFQSHLKALSTTLKSSPQLLGYSLYLDFFVQKGGESRGRRGATHSLRSGTVHLHKVTGVKITNQRIVTVPSGWETFWSLWRSNQECMGRIQSLCFS